MAWADARRRGRAVVRSFFKVNGFYTAGGATKMCGLELSATGGEGIAVLGTPRF